jgi:hypothetical protein
MESTPEAYKTISFDYTFSVHARKAVAVYHGATTASKKPRVSLQACPMRVGITLKF